MKRSGGFSSSSETSEEDSLSEDEDVNIPRLRE